MSLVSHSSYLMQRGPWHLCPWHPERSSSQHPWWQCAQSCHCHHLAIAGTDVAGVLVWKSHAGFRERGILAPISSTSCHGCRLEEEYEWQSHAMLFFSSMHGFYCIFKISQIRLRNHSAHCCLYSWTTSILFISLLNACFFRKLDTIPKLSDIPVFNCRGLLNQSSWIGYKFNVVSFKNQLIFLGLRYWTRNTWPHLNPTDVFFAQEISDFIKRTILSWTTLLMGKWAYTDLIL